MSMPFIPVASPLRQYESHKRAIDEAVAKVLHSGRYILGEEVVCFEREFADFLGSRHCVTVANGTEALCLALQACGVCPGDEVITVSHTAVATVAAIELAGAVPVFIDIDPCSRCMDHRMIENALSSKTRAIVPVHIYGQPARMHEICEIARRHGLIVVEDCAQACGARISNRKVGTFGHAAAFSFYPTKNLGAIGDGGCVVTDSPEVSEKLRALREYGWKDRYISSEKGMNSRLDELQAAILRVKLPFLDKDNTRRRAIAERYSHAVDNLSIIPPCPVPDTDHVMHLYVVECSERHSLQEFLKERGVGTALHYPKAVHQQGAYQGRIRGSESLPATEELYERILSLPMYPELSDTEVENICVALADWCSSRSPGDVRM
ncbi:MAG: DegT/DnrJ/EryC1/StrS family aminotransferase [Deltaproteobacteria bacterium]|jgi:dTDP-4-amino-4,6-dideoxygalactose transaminase|nr:DegT/DnrJ/EryC1/StrS family aminotransferase [Deltaproteobacteria bacterium]